MKKTILLISIVYFLFGTLVINSQNVVITDDSTYTADNSAMLDVKSDTKGFLVPRLNSIQKDNISQPATGLLIFQTDGKQGFYYNNGTPSSPDWEFLSSSSSVLWLKGPDNTTTLLSNKSDSVGIGTQFPEEKLDVSGNLILDYFQPLILFKEDSLEAAKIQHFGPQTDGYLHLQAWDGNNFEATGLVVRSPYQNVGVGTITPAYKLDVIGTARMNGFILPISTDSGYVLTSDENGVGTWKPAASHIDGTGTPNYIPKFTDNDTIANSNIYEDATGKIGIGITNPQTKLDVNGKLNMRNNIKLNNNWLSGDGSDKGIIIKSNGKVGIGTSNPGSLLTTNGMIEAKDKGFKFPDGTVQETAVAPDKTGPESAADGRWVIAMDCSNFPGSWEYTAYEDCSKVIDLEWGINLPFDPGSGLPTGNRNHQALSVIKNIDRGSVNYIKYLAQGQNIDELKFTFFWEELQTQQIVPYYIITLHNVRVVNFEHKVFHVGNDVFAHTDKISFVYEEIEWEWMPDNLQWQDTWIYMPK
ncbi:MAG: type VI secretion system tube protein Hcp [Bacteroidales bacterium]|nr:type VI secretion system tube protein Hcp [Bacteroidales bacterium]